MLDVLSHRGPDGRGVFAEQGVVLGLNQSLMSVAQIVGPAIAGALIDRGWLSTWAFWTALITVVNASEGWRSVILGCLILGMLPLSGRDQSR